ncbi:g9319 [Coccomyxa elongata]
MLSLRFLQMGAPKLRAALLPDKGGKRTELLLDLPEASVDHFSSPEEAANRCKSDMSVLLIPHSKTEPAIDFISGPVLWWQATKAKTHSLVRSAVTEMVTAMKGVHGGRPAQLHALQRRIDWVDESVELRLPVLCFALPSKRFDSAYKSKRPYTENGRCCKCQEDVVHQVAVRILVEEIVKICSKPATAARFTEEVEHLAFPEDESSAVAMDVDAGICSNGLIAML